MKPFRYVSNCCCLSIYNWFELKYLSSNLAVSVWTLTGLIPFNYYPTNERMCLILLKCDEDYRCQKVEPLLLLFSCTGAVFINSCSLQPYIPIFLIMGGILLMLKTFFLIIHSFIVRNAISHPTMHSGKNIFIWAWSIFNIIFNFFLLVWTVASSYWVYSNYREVIESDYSSCSEVIYKFSFSVVTSCYIILLALCCTCCLVGSGFGIGKRSSARSDSNCEVANDWDLANASLPRERQERSEEGAMILSYRDGTNMDQQSRARDMPDTVAPVRAAFYGEPVNTGSVDNLYVNTQTFPRIVPLNSEAVDGRTGSTNLSAWSSGGHQAIHGMQSHAQNLGKTQQAHSSANNLDLNPDFSFRNCNRSDCNCNGAFRNMLSHASLVPTTSAPQHKLTAFEHARSNPILFDPDHQRNNQARTMSTHHHHSRSSLRATDINTPCLYTTIRSDGCSTTHV